MIIFFSYSSHFFFFCILSVLSSYRADKRKQVNHKDRYLTKISTIEWNDGAMVGMGAVDEFRNARRNNEEKKNGVVIVW